MRVPRPLLLTLSMLPLVGSAQAAQPPVAVRPAQTSLNRDVERCRLQANLDACFDAVRRNPSDPAILVALGDALKRAKRPADAVRAYKRAAALAPAMRGIGEKITAAETKPAPAHRARAQKPAAKDFSNVDPVAQAH